MPTDPVLLTSVAAHLDKHLLLPVLEFAASKATAASAKSEFTQAIATVKAQTSIGASGEQKEELDKAFAKTLKAVGPLRELFFDQAENGTLTLKYAGRDFGEALRQGKFGSSELKKAGVKPKMIKALYDVAFALVESGEYEQAAGVLKVHNVLTIRDSPDADDETNDRNASALWGALLCEIRLGHADQMRQTLDELLRMLDERGSSTSNRSRAALLHWALFYYMKNNETAALLDLAFAYDRIDRSKSYLYANVAQTIAPHFLRYIAIAAVMNKKKKMTLMRAARLVEGDSYQYSDCFTNFLTELCVKTDFVKASECLAECDRELANDFFCCDLREAFIANARQMIFEDQLRVRKSLSIAASAQQLSMTPEEAELWLVDLIREAKMDATVDSVAGIVRVNAFASQKSVWQHVMDRLDQAAPLRQTA